MVTGKGPAGPFSGCRTACDDYALTVEPRTVVAIPWWAEVFVLPLYALAWCVGAVLVALVFVVGLTVAGVEALLERR